MFKFKFNLLSCLDLKSIINAIIPEDITSDNEHIAADLNLLITQKTPHILSDEELVLKIQKLKYEKGTTDEQRAMIQKPLLDLAQLPTGKNLLSVLPDNVTFNLASLENPGTHGIAHHHYSDGSSTITLNSQSFYWSIPALMCGTVAHEIRHVIQRRYDPILRDQDYPFTSDNKLYTFDKIQELDAKFLTQRIAEEWFEKFKDEESEDYRGQKKQFINFNSDYFQYRDYLGKESTEPPETKEKISNTLYAIDSWYGITFPDWRQTYHEQAKKGNRRSFFASFFMGFPESATISAELEDRVTQSYIDNMNVGLPVEFFDENKDCTIEINGHKLFERKIEKNGNAATVTLFFANGNPSYQTHLHRNLLNPNMNWQKEHEEYFYEDGLKKAEYEYEKSFLPVWNYPYRCGPYTHYYDSISPKTGKQRICESGSYYLTSKGAFGRGVVFADNDEKEEIEKRCYFRTGELAQKIFLSGEHKGLCLGFYTTGQLCSRCKSDPNGVGQGYYQRYRCDARNSLELSGYLINNVLSGPYKKYNEQGDVIEEGYAKNGALIPMPTAESRASFFTKLTTQEQLDPYVAAALSKQQHNH